MQAQILQEGDIKVIFLMGYMDFETVEPFRKTCFSQLMHQKVVFDLSKLHFVGSSGISVFIEVFKGFSKSTNEKPRFSGLNSEFRRFFIANEYVPKEVFETTQEAVRSFSLDPQALASMPSLLLVNEDPEVEIESVAAGAEGFSVTPPRTSES